MFILNANNSTPLYRQLYQQIRDQVLSGELPAHSRLPSIRNLAVELEISRNTVEGAFQELCAEGYLYSKSRSGYYVSCKIRSTLDTHSDLNWTPIPELTGQCFRF